MVELETEVQELKEKLENVHDMVFEKKKHYAPTSAVNKFSSYSRPSMQSQEKEPADFESMHHA